MKTIGSALQAHLAQDVTTICTCWNITRTDGAVFTFTDHDTDLMISGVTYKASNGYKRTAMKSDQILSVDNLDVSGIMIDANGIQENELKRGIFDYAAVKVFLVNWSDLGQGVLALRSGLFGEVTVNENGIFNTEIRGLTQYLTQEFGYTFTPYCNADLGDARCKVPAASPCFGETNVTGVLEANKTFTAAGIVYPAYTKTTTAIIHFLGPTVMGASIDISDGVHDLMITMPGAYPAAAAATTVADTINNANAAGTFNGTAVVQNNYWVFITLTDPTAAGIITTSGFTNAMMTMSGFADGALNGGVVKWLTGNNAGLSMEIKQYSQGGNTVSLWLGMPYTIQVGDTFSYWVGCDKTRETCYNKFNNILNFRGTPDIPGQDQLSFYPNAN